MDNNNVTDRKSFIKFLDELKLDVIANKNSWENKSIENYLDALAAYTEDIQGYYNNTNQDINADIPSWKVFADLLIGAAIYE